ncbi:hypothetical protein Vretimale_12533 [Volvox reticuliferus]|uniref:ASCH domain-containing protein n=1 Tax=Volvox reticuliferus TaxID=1737510 RepID=A0A8J4GKE9_9CHLO|nr:hypothetical protein Vretifemale_9148 [Volvox reticuliferus]GIM08516.1 hypothetical protein Vretimale_12533 [Volvox reticuliferus]
MSEQGTNVMAQLSQPAVAATAADSISLATVLAPRRPLSRDSTLMPLYLELIRSGAKTVEGRIRAGKWTDVIPGDIFRFVSTQTSARGSTASVTCCATSVRCYDSFRAMLEREGLDACLPGVISLEDGVEVYRSIPGYREREAVEGVVAVGLKLLPHQEDATRGGCGDGSSL